MSQEETNKRVVQRFYEEVWNQHKLDVVDELFEQDYVVAVLPPWRKPGAAGLKEFVADNHRMFPDVHTDIIWMVAEGDKVATFITGTGTHKGDLNGPVGLVPATGKRVSWNGGTFFSLRNGKIHESRGVIDNMSLMQQLGAVGLPEPQQ